MLFIKKGLVYEGHAQLPTIEDRNDQIRIYYSFRINKQSFINYIEISKKNLKVTYKNKKPILKPGERGSFDDAGVMPSCISEGVMYYTGWNLKLSVPYGQSIGCAIFNESKNHFERLSSGPILDRCTKIPYLANSAFVKNNNMFFCNGTGWEGNFPKYNIWLAKKINSNWVVDSHVLGGEKEAYSRPYVYDKNTFILSKKNKKNNYEIFMYKNTKFKKIISKSKNKYDWDFEMTCYPYLFDNFIFYNGNGYGSSGIGLCELVSE
jgi:hypothetical protein